MAKTTTALKPIEKAPADSFRELGSTGLAHFAGFIDDEFVRELQSAESRTKFFREIRDNSPAIGGAMLAIENILRRTPIDVEPGGPASEDEQVAEFVEENLHEMTQSWGSVLSQALSMLTYGWSYHEQVYQRRADGRIAWRKFPIRSQESFDGWKFDETGGIQGMYQRPAPTYRRIFIPIEKALLFRTTDHKGSPEGRSVLRNCVMPWKFTKRIQIIEAIGIERDLAGLPVMGVPPEVLAAGSGDSTDAQALMVYNACKKLVTNIRRDEQEGIVFPLSYDAQGKPRYELKLLTTGGSRQFDTDKVVGRYELRMLQSMLADFIFVGHEKVGSFSLSSDKTDLFAVAIATYLESILEVFNQYAIPRLLELNGWDNLAPPKLTHGDIESPDLAVLGGYVKSLADAGLLLPSTDGKLESTLLELANLPHEPEEVVAAQQAAQQQEQAAVEAQAAAQAAQPKPPTVAKWDEADHPRGKTTEESTPGSFAPDGGAAGAESASPASGNQLTAREQAAVEHYRGQGFLTMNAQLRGDAAVSASVTDRIESLDAAIAKGRTSESVTVFRGTRHAGLTLQQAHALVGREVSSPAFLSTSSDEGVAHQFANWADGVVYEIALPRGSRALDVSVAGKMEGLDYQNEILLPRNSHFRITGVGRRHGRLTLQMTPAR